MASLKHAAIIWYRELLRYWRDKARIAGSLAMPFFFLIIFGAGLSSAIGGMLGGAGPMEIDFKKFMFPGIIGMTTLFTSMFSGLSVVRDREYGFLKEILVAPVNRTAIAAGKILGASTVTMIQATLLLVLAPIAGISISIDLVLKIWGLVFIAATAFTGLGTFVGSRLRSTEGFQMVMNFLIMPMFFLSGAFFPLKGVPIWMTFATKLNPFSYVVDSIRQVIFSSMGLPAAIMSKLPEFGLGISLFGHNVSLLADICILCVTSLLLSSLAIWGFRRMT